MEWTELPVLLLVSDGSAIPMAQPMQHTGEMDWSQVKIHHYHAFAQKTKGMLYDPVRGQLYDFAGRKISPSIRSITRWKIK